MAHTEPPSVPIQPYGSAVAGHDGDRIVGWLRGEHDIATAAELSETLARAIAIDDADLVVDLSQLQFMDASTIGVIVRVGNFLLQRSRSLSLRAPAVYVRRVLDACGLAELVYSGPPRSEAGCALGSWVAVPAIARAGRRADGPPRPRLRHRPHLDTVKMQGATVSAAGRAR